MQERVAVRDLYVSDILTMGDGEEERENVGTGILRKYQYVKNVSKLHGII